MFKAIRYVFFVNFCIISASQLTQFSYQNCDQLMAILKDGDNEKIFLKELGFRHNGKVMDITGFSDSDQNSIFHYLCWYGYTPIIKYYDQRYNFQNLKNKDQRTPLFFVKDPTILCLAIAKVQDLLVQDINGDIPLVWHIKCNNVDVVRSLMLLMKKYQVIDCVVRLKLFEHVKSLEMTKILSQSYECRMTINGSQLLLDSELLCRAELIFWSIINMQSNVNIKDIYDETLLHYALKKQRAQFIDIFLEKGIDATAQNKRGETTLHYAVLYNDIASAQKLLDSVQNKIEFLNCKNKEGQSALMVAVMQNNLDMIYFLISLGADIFTKNCSGHGLLHFVQDVPLARHLLEKGLSVNDAGKYGDTPLHFAANVDIAQFFIENGANIDAQNDDGECCLHTARNNALAMYLSTLSTKILSIKDKQGRTALQRAIFSYNAQRFQILLQSYDSCPDKIAEQVIKLLKCSDRNDLYVQENLKDVCIAHNILKDELFIPQAYPDTLPEEQEYQQLRELYYHINQDSPPIIFQMSMEEYDRMCELHKKLMCSF